MSADQVDLADHALRARLAADLERFEEPHPTSRVIELLSGRCASSLCRRSR